MTYFAEIYEGTSHVGTKTLRATTEGEAADEVCALLRSIHNPYTRAILFEQPPMANYRVLAEYSLFAPI